MWERTKKVFGRVTDGFTGQAGLAGTHLVQSKPDWCSRKVVLGQEAGKFWARPVETLHNQDLGL